MIEDLMASARRHERYESGAGDMAVAEVTTRNVFHRSVAREDGVLNQLGWLIWTATWMFWVAVLVPFWVKSEKLRGVQWFGLLCAFVAVVFALREGFTGGIVSTARGDLLGLAAGMAGRILDETRGHIDKAAAELLRDDAPHIQGNPQHLRVALAMRPIVMVERLERRR